MPDIKYKAEDLKGISVEQLVDLERIFAAAAKESQKRLSQDQSNLSKIRKEIKNRKRNGR